MPRPSRTMGWTAINRPSRSTPDAVPGPFRVPFRGRREILRAGLEMGLDHLLDQLDAEAGAVGGAGEAFLEDRLRNAGDHVLPPRDVDGMVLEGDEVLGCRRAVQVG